LGIPSPPRPPYKRQIDECDAFISYLASKGFTDTPVEAMIKGLATVWSRVKED